MSTSDEGAVLPGFVPGPPGRPLVIVVNGSPGGHRDGPRLLRRLVRRGYRVAVVAPSAAAWRSAAAGTWLRGLAGPGGPAVEAHLLGVGAAGGLALRAAAHDPAFRTVHLLGTPVELPRLEPRPRSGEAGPPAFPTGETVPRRPPFAPPLTAAELYEIEAAVRYAYAPDDPLTPPRDVALMKLAVRRCELTALPACGGSTPSGPAVRRWASAGFPGFPGRRFLPGI